MASLRITKPSPCSLPFFQSSHSNSTRSDYRKGVLRLASCREYRVQRSLRVRCAAQEGDNQAKGEEPPESLFMKELKRRGMNPTSLLEDYEDDGVRTEEESRSTSKRNGSSTKVDPSLSNQRERSMALNSEGLEGLIPRAKLLLTIGGTFFLGFWPLIIFTVASFCALYLYFGQDFIHDAGKTAISPPQYVDPYALLEDERMSEVVPPI